MPKGGEWETLKRGATRYVKAGEDADKGEGNATPETVLANFVRAIRDSAPSYGIGSAGGVTSGGSGGGGSGGTTAISSGSAQKVAVSLGNFLSSVGTSGLGTALTQIGLADLIGQSANQIASALLDKFAGPASTIDDQAARLACDDLRKELLENAVTAEDVENALTQKMDFNGLGGILMRYFSLYIFRSFCTGFYEVWVKKVGVAQAKSKLASIKKYMDVRLKGKMKNTDVTAFNWKGKQGQQLMSQILGDTCKVFEVGDGGAA